MLMEMPFLLLLGLRGPLRPVSGMVSGLSGGMQLEGRLKVQGNGVAVIPAGLELLEQLYTTSQLANNPDRFLW